MLQDGIFWRDCAPTYGINTTGADLMVTKRASTTNSKRKTTAAGNRTIDPDMRRRLIAAEAYFLAERRGFVPGNELADWVAAESTVDSKFKHLA
jgi:hypothetical protein